MGDFIYYDIIGDIHGHADELESLLQTMAYKPEGPGYAAPRGHMAVFVGDFVDRGPRILRTLEIVRSMVETGQALAIAGNHELNALRYHTPASDGQPLRAHTPKNRKQHQETLDQVATPKPEFWEETLQWFSTLPLWLELDGLRVVHACWCAHSMEVLDGINPLARQKLESFSKSGSKEHHALSILLNGPEAKIAGGQKLTIHDSMRDEIRIRWWQQCMDLSVSENIFPGQMVDKEWKIIPLARTWDYPADAPPVFFGHYSTSEGQSLPLPNVACVDWSLGKGGQLAAYRWCGEERLSMRKFISASSR